MNDKILKTSWDDHYMYDAFLGFVRFSLGEENALQAYRNETGDTYELGKTPIDRMIDEATGADFRFIQSFSNWCEGIFGKPEDVDETPSKG